MSQNVQIIFDPPSGVYYGGQMVSGVVQVTLTKSVKVKGISLHIYGYGKVEWYDQSKKKKKTGRPDYTGTEEYLSMNTNLVQAENDTLELPPGIHSYIFKCHLAEDLPTSFEGTNGCIKYIVKVTLERPWKFNETYTAGFTVLRMLDLNRESPQSKLPIEFEHMQTNKCWICKSTPLVLVVKLAKTGFVPGETISVNGRITNLGPNKVEEVRIYLRRIVSYRAEKPIVSFMEECTDLVHKTSEHLQSGSSDIFVENVIVPEVPPTTLFHSKIIRINYDLKVEVVLGANEKNPFVLCPITIGTAPLLPELTNSSAAANEEPAVSVPEEANVQNLSPVRRAPEIPPPSYEESIERMETKLDEGREHPIQSTEFSPKCSVPNLQPTVCEKS